ISVGLGYGDNFRSVFVAQSMREMEYFLDKVVPRRRNLLASAYLGDTLVTAYSPYSRNRTFGVMIGKGYTVAAAKLELNMVAEGYYATNALKAIAHERHLEMPILETAYRILYDKISPAIEMHLLAEGLS
ncbi:MAG: glycerol-3-phosphate dehydrogenase, partial [Bacteroidota bacterium]|nr:glycerol-3-phosphate dehydrogenase [Bacteroidota bacterium]